MKAVVLLSGGLDSATVAAMMRASGAQIYCLSFDYGQRHRIELDRAGQLAQVLGAADHRVVRLDLRAFGGSALTDSELAVPKEETPAGEIPVTYVPARNTIFLSFALAYAEVKGIDAVAIGVNAVDYSGYPDCRPEYIEAFAHMATLATKAGVTGHPFRILTPLIAMTKVEIIRAGLSAGLDYALTTSCYDPSPAGAPCQACDSCRIRMRAFGELGMVDPLLATN